MEGEYRDHFETAREIKEDAPKGTTIKLPKIKGRSADGENPEISLSYELEDFVELDYKNWNLVLRTDALKYVAKKLSDSYGDIKSPQGMLPFVAKLHCEFEYVEGEGMLCRPAGIEKCTPKGKTLRVELLPIKDECARYGERMKKCFLEWINGEFEGKKCVTEYNDQYDYMQDVYLKDYMDDKKYDILYEKIRALEICVFTRYKKTDIHINIDLIDINNQAPYFVGTPYHAILYVSEYTAVGKTLFKVEARDDDFARPNNVVSFSIETCPFQEFFEIPDKLDGTITLRKRFKFDEVDSFYLIIKAQDGGVDVTFSNTTNMTVEVAFSPDLNPVFIGAPYKAYVLDNSYVGFLLDIKPRRLTAVDESGNSPVLFRFQNETEARNSGFIMSSNSGAVRVAGKLTPGAHHFLLIMAITTRSKHRYTTNVLEIFVNDTGTVTEDRIIKRTVLANTPADSNIVTLGKRADDSEGHVTWHLKPKSNVSSDAMKKFSLTYSGQLKNVAVLDSKLPSYEFLVTSVGGRRAPRQFDVKIDILKTNNKNPTFSQKAYTFYYDRNGDNFEVGYVYASNSAKDKMRYRIVGLRKYFQVIDGTDDSGIVQTNKLIKELCTDTAYFGVIACNKAKNFLNEEERCSAAKVKVNFIGKPGCTYRKRHMIKSCLIAASVVLACVIVGELIFLLRRNSGLDVKRSRKLMLKKS